jgi:hypothetical protein
MKLLHPMHQMSTMKKKKKKKNHLLLLTLQLQLPTTTTTMTTLETSRIPTTRRGRGGGEEDLKVHLIAK